MLLGPVNAIYCACIMLNVYSTIVAGYTQRQELEMIQTCDHHRHHWRFGFSPILHGPSLDLHCELRSNALVNMLQKALQQQWETRLQKQTPAVGGLTSSNGVIHLKIPQKATQNLQYRAEQLIRDLFCEHGMRALHPNQSSNKLKCCENMF